MDDAPAGGHEVDLAGFDRLDIAFAVAVHHLALEQIGEGGQADMRMGSGVHAGACPEHDRSETVEKDERPHHAALRGRQRPTDIEVPQVAGRGEDDLSDRLVVGLKRHGGSPGKGSMDRKERQGGDLFGGEAARQ
jgi:hypothetical protein